MSSPQNQGDPGLALQYLAEVANTYGQTLSDVVKAPFINQVNTCLKVIQAGLATAEAPPKVPAPKPKKG